MTLDRIVDDQSDRDRVMLAAGRCYDCFRPAASCFCDMIPRIDNRIEVLILQHRREHFHRFNTARIVHKSLRNSRLLADHTRSLAQRIQLRPKAGLLYPGPSALSIYELPVDERPEQLVVLDGTWHHAKTLLRDIPILQTLPRYQLSPTEPSRYRIRREPNALALSTVEAAVAALKALEPETLGFDQLLAAFDKMVDVQLAHPGSVTGARFRTRLHRSFKNIPFVLHKGQENIVVAYGEAQAGERGQKRVDGPPISWVAQRLIGGELFSCKLMPSRPLNDVFLGHLELARSDFDHALSLDDARALWAEFERPGDVVTVLRPGTARLFRYLAGDQATCLVLKAVDLALEPSEFTLDVSPHAESIQFAEHEKSGRAGRRLLEAIAVVRHLNAIANEQLRGGLRP